MLNRLTKKGWLAYHRHGKAFVWTAKVSADQAKAVKSYEQLQQFLAISNPDVVAAFADSLDTASIDQLSAIANRLQAARQQRQEEK